MSLCFALPPSLGTNNVRTLARQFAAVLYEAGFSSVVPVKSYELLERSLLNGEVHAAWGPPMVCARVEGAGGAVALQAVRYGCTSYRSALLCRAQDDLVLDEVGAVGLRKLRAAWVDRHSMAGCIMPRHHLRSRGIDVDSAFESEIYLGSYEACFDAVMECQADITASYANSRGIGYVELCKEEAFHLRTFAYTAECPNDGVIVSPDAMNSDSDIFGRLARLMAVPEYRGILCAALEVDGLEQPPAGSYGELLQLVE